MPTIKDIDPMYFVQDDEFVAEFCKANGLDPNGFIDKEGHAAHFSKNFLLKYRSEFSHDEEKATTGYYSVNLLDDDINVELTTGEFVGMHRYRFNKESEMQHLILDLGFNINRDRPTETSVKQREDGMITGYRFSTGWADVHRVYFAMQFSRVVNDIQFFRADDTSETNNARGQQLAAVFSFDGRKDKVLLVKVAISSASEEGAIRNLKTADPTGWDFDKLHQATDKEKSGTVSKTLEYSYDDWCVAQVAEYLGKTDDYRKYIERSHYYRNLYDPSYRLMRGKNSDGSWFEPFHPRFAGYGNPHTTEGNSWQYSFFAPHDITGLIGQYAHGNEPSHHIAYLYDFIGKPGETQFYTNKIINTLYGDGPEGICGNEDCGQMSAWYVFRIKGISRTCLKLNGLTIPLHF